MLGGGCWRLCRGKRGDPVVKEASAQVEESSYKRWMLLSLYLYLGMQTLQRERGAEILDWCEAFGTREMLCALLNRTNE